MELVISSSPPERELKEALIERGDVISCPFTMESLCLLTKTLAAMKA
jgi:hypothetical protein